MTVFVAAAPHWQWFCPHCDQSVSRYDKRRRQWRHLDAMQFKTLLDAEAAGPAP